MVDDLRFDIAVRKVLLRTNLEIFLIQKRGSKALKPLLIDVLLFDINKYFLCSNDTFVYPFTLRVPLESVVCYFHTFENNLGIK